MQWISEIMDFYYKYKDQERTLCSTFRHKKVILNLYRVQISSGVNLYVLVKNRNTIYENVKLRKVEERFFDSIYFESGVKNPELFNS